MAIGLDRRCGRSDFAIKEVSSCFKVIKGIYSIQSIREQDCPTSGQSYEVNLS